MDYRKNAVALKFAVAVVAALSVSGATIAQDIGGAFINAGIGNSGIEAVNQAILENSQGKRPAPDNEDAKSSSARFTYTPSKSRTRQNLQNFVNKTRAVDPAGAAQLEQAFARQDVIAEMGHAMQTVGLSRNNVADAFAVYWVNAWQAANGDGSTPSTQTMQAVSAQASRGLSRSALFADATDAQKQELAEVLMIQGLMIAQAIHQAKGDKALQKAVADAVAQGAKASGLTLDGITLTEKGFVRAKSRAK